MAMIEVDEHSGEVLDRVMEENKLKSREEAIKLIIDEYERISEPELRPEFVEKLKKIEKGEFKEFDSVDELRKEVEDVQSGKK